MKKDQPKNSAFTLMFSVEKHAVQLYELLTGEKINPQNIESVRLEDGLVRSPLYNDVSFLTKDNRLLVLIEHQSTPCGNMMFRMLEYYVALAGKFIEAYQLNKFGTKQIHIPKAEFFVVYNGRGQKEELLPLDLGSVQVEAKLLNIHYDRLPDHGGDNSVAAYGRFLQLVEVEKLHINDAIDQLLEEGYLTEFFGRREVRNMLAEIFSYDRQIFERGVEQGTHEKAVEMASRLIKKGMTLEEASEVTELGIEEVRAVI